jgi:hypothetical protein
LSQYIVVTRYALEIFISQSVQTLFKFKVNMGFSQNDPCGLLLAKTYAIKTSDKHPVSLFNNRIYQALFSSVFAGQDLNLATKKLK